MTDKVPISEKFLLTLDEATAYFSIGEKKLTRMIKDFIASPNEELNNIILEHGNKRLIKRQKFEKYINSATVI